jgi:hypothetical protein
MTGWLGNGSANCGWLVSRLMTSCLMDYFRVPTISAYSVLCIHPFLPSEFFTQTPLFRNSYEKEHNDFNGCWRLCRFCGAGCECGAGIALQPEL